MGERYIDFLLVKKRDESLTLVTAESCSAKVGYLVEFNGGELGRVVKKAWAGQEDGKMVDLITAMVPSYEAEAIYWCRWKKEASDGEISESS